MNLRNLEAYQKQFFENEWAYNVKQFNRSEIEEILTRANYLLDDKIVFTDSFDMEACHTPYSFSGNKWNSYPENDPEWTFMLSRQGFMVDLAIAFSITKDNQYFEKWESIIFGFVEENGEPNDSNKLSWRPIDAGIRLMNWMKSLTYLSLDKISTRLLEVMDESIQKHISFLQRSYIDKYRLSNWGVLALSGIAVYDLIFPGKLTESEHNWVWFHLTHQLELQFYSDGVHWEVSPLYHHEVVANFCYILQVSEYLDIVLPIDLRSELALPIKAAHYMAGADDYLSPLNDSDYVNFAYVYNIYRGMGFLPKTRNNRCDLYLGHKYSQDEPCDQVELPALFKGEKSGFSVLKTEGIYFTLFNGWHGSSHGHASNGSFTLNYLNQEIISDGGRFSYTESPVRLRLKTPEAHNTIFDEGDQSTIISDSWGYEQLPQPVFQQAEKNDLGYLFSNAWVLNSKYSKQTSFYARDVVILEQFGVILIYDSYRGNGEELTTTFNFNEGCRIEDNVGKPLAFHTSSFSGRLVLPNQTYWLREQQRSNVYNQLSAHTQVVSKSKVINGQVNNLTMISLHDHIRFEKLDVKQNGSETETYFDGTGIRVLGESTKYLDVYFIFNDVVKGNKLFKTENNQFFYGKITAFDENNNRIKLK
ncbi:heparinase [Halolactibacillus alkaliphilus]|uniref:Heparinase n=1 Tax=Halolactibacillus alkaliphilus TaxID=442899 RepID=A0A511WWP5_9BACI|nr:heparinase II/III family protein [Halolactibacillus alkaliphilus]GEN55544.1 heparinase [Halolactibacillus alkaliphilus]GGN64134.1 heparinase [Halolactibacillus alkaliphilus]SFO61815.1 Heparinase II/III-like protein [Halolactibacillus alkaliphilus]